MIKEGDLKTMSDIQALEKRVAELEKQVQEQQLEKEKFKELIHGAEALKKLLNEVADYNKGTLDGAS